MRKIVIGAGVAMAIIVAPVQGQMFRPAMDGVVARCLSYGAANCSSSAMDYADRGRADADRLSRRLYDMSRSLDRTRCEHIMEALQALQESASRGMQQRMARWIEDGCGAGTVRTSSFGDNDGEDDGGNGPIDPAPEGPHYPQGPGKPGGPNHPGSPHHPGLGGPTRPASPEWPDMPSWPEWDEGIDGRKK
ncbi:hypothetical protein [Devosia sp. RR2S18]|uniref:hypothetical protein n=1 Tax=Devosia rhizosphaerae TaxID=3049774 RepID=UPI002540C454|nr:hypothetical protein [Devosia sp. RR2S18]WIJ23930.1 hypothetical protein QOV41_12875 [Devosia sp. RR2S18]